MTVKCIVGCLVGSVLVLGSVAQASAAGEGIQLGPALVFPSLSVTETYDDNLNLASTDTVSDWETSIAPAVRLLLPVRRFYLEAEGGLDFLSYKDATQNNTTDWYAGVAVGADFPGGLSFKLGGKQTSTFLVGSQEFGPGEGSELNTLRGAVAYKVRDALRLELTGLRTEYVYDRSRGRERAENSLLAGLSWRFRPSLSAVVEVSSDSYVYDTNSAQDGSAVQVSLGLSWDVTARSTGFAKAGYQWKSYDVENAALGTENAGYYTLSGGLRHNFTQRTMVQLDLSRASAESDFPDNPYYLKTGIGASLSQRFTTKVYGRAGLRYDTEGYPNSTTYTNPYDPALLTHTGTRTDTVLEATAAVGFDMTRWLALELGYTGESRDSSFDTFDYTVNRVSLSAKAVF